MLDKSAKRVAAAVLISAIVGLATPSVAAPIVVDWTRVRLEGAGISVEYPTGWIETVPASLPSPVELEQYLNNDGYDVAGYWEIDLSASTDEIFAQWYSHARHITFGAIDLADDGDGSSVGVSTGPYPWLESLGRTGWWKSFDEFKRKTLLLPEGKVVFAEATRVGGRPAFMRIEKDPAFTYEGRTYPPDFHGLMVIRAGRGRFIQIGVSFYRDPNFALTKRVLQSVAALN